MELTRPTVPVIPTDSFRDADFGHERTRRFHRQAIRRFGTVLGLVLLCLALRSIDPHRALSLVWRLGPGAVFLLLPSAVGVACETFAWQRAIGALGRRVNWSSLYRIRVTSESLAAVLPLGALWADAARPKLLAEWCGLSIGEGIASAMIRKYLLVLSQAAYLLLAFVFGKSILEAGFDRAAGLPGLSLVALAGALALALVAELTALTLRGGTALESVLDLLARVARRPVPGVRWLAQGSRSTDRAAACFFEQSLRRRLALAAPCLAGWLLEATESWVFLLALGARVSWNDALAVEAVVVLGRHVLVFLPGGLGVLEFGYASFFAGTGASVDVCAAFVVMKRLREAFWASAGYLSWTADRPSSNCHRVVGYLGKTKA